MSGPDMEVCCGIVVYMFGPPQLGGARGLSSSVVEPLAHPSSLVIRSPSVRGTRTLAAGSLRRMGKGPGSPAPLAASRCFGSSGRTSLTRRQAGTPPHVFSVSCFCSHRGDDHASSSSKPLPNVFGMRCLFDCGRSTIRRPALHDLALPCRFVACDHETASWETLLL